jgi:hypothetical protein
MQKVSGPQVVTPAEASEMPLPAAIQEALGELVGAAREGLLGLPRALLSRRLPNSPDSALGVSGSCR